jgi:hypothetical protein
LIVSDVKASSGDVLAAVGLPLGIVFSPSEGSYVTSVRCATTFFTLELPQYDTWGSALIPRSREMLTSWCVERGYPEVDTLIDELLDAGLLVAISSFPNDHSWMGCHRLYPVGAGVGNSLEREHVFTIATTAMVPAITVNIGVYNVWAASNTCSSLEEVVTQVAADLGVGRDELCRCVLDALPALLQTRVAHLDRT